MDVQGDKKPMIYLYILIGLNVIAIVLFIEIRTLIHKAIVADLIGLEALEENGIVLCDVSGREYQLVCVRDETRGVKASGMEGSKSCNTAAHHFKRKLL